MVAVVAAAANVQNCILDLRSSRDSMVGALSSYSQTQNIDVLIGDVAKLTKSLPTMMEDCGDQSAADSFRKSVPDICIDDMEKATKLGMKLLNETDNEAKFALGTS